MVVGGVFLGFRVKGFRVYLGFGVRCALRDLGDSDKVGLAARFLYPIVSTLSD